jgi:chromosome segregation ATPase
VTTIAPPAADLADAQPLCESLGQLRSVCSGLDDFMRGLFDELRTLYDDVDRRRGDVSEMRRQLDGEANQLETQRRQIDEQRLGLDEQREQLTTATERLCEAKRELEEQRDAISRQAATEEAALKKQLADINAERDRLIGERDAAVKKAAQSNGSAAETAALTREINNLKAALEDKEAELSDVQTRADRSKADGKELRSRLNALEADLAEAQAQLENGAGEGSSAGEAALRKQVQELINERSVVELQLESVRDRAAELTERLEEQDRQFAAERKRWQSELGEVTRLLTLNSRYGNGAPVNLPAGSTVAVDQRSTATHVEDEPSEPAAANPVVDSVMAQFRAVQKAAAKRRVGAK